MLERGEQRVELGKWSRWLVLSLRNLDDASGKVELNR